MVLNMQLIFGFTPVLLSIKRSNCYMVWGGEFSNSQQTRVSQEDFVIGCLVDLDTGLMTFTANGKEINTFYQVRYASGAQSSSHKPWILVL